MSKFKIGKKVKIMDLDEKHNGVIVEKGSLKGDVMYKVETDGLELWYAERFLKEE